MPITGFKTGDAVLTPGGKEGLVWDVMGLNAIVRIDGTDKYATFRQAALRRIRRPVLPIADEYCHEGATWSANPVEQL